MPTDEQKTNYEPMYAALAELGLTGNEQKLYVASLSAGPTSLTALAEQLGIPRPNLYKLIESLEQNGLVASAMRKRYARHFVVESPTVVAERLREHREKQARLDRTFVDSLPSFLSQYRQGEGALKIRVLTGRAEFSRMFDHMFDEIEGELLFFGSIIDFDRAVGRDEIMRNVDRRVARGVNAKSLLLPNGRGYLSMKTHREHLREIRYLTTLTPFLPMFHVFMNKVIIWQPVTPVAVVIEDEYIVAMFKSIFFGFWNSDASEPAGMDE